MLIHHDPDRYMVEIKSTTCPFHEANPGKDETRVEQCPHEHTMSARTGDGLKVVRCADCGELLHMDRVPWPDEEVRPTDPGEDKVEAVAKAIEETLGLSDAQRSELWACYAFDRAARAAIAAMGHTPPSGEDG